MGTSCYTLTSSEFKCNADQDTVTITLNDADLNAIKKNDKLVLPATATTKTSLSYTEELFEDFRGNKAANDVLDTLAVKVDTLVYDTTDPRLISFTIDMDLGKSCSPSMKSFVRTKWSCRPSRSSTPHKRQRARATR